MSREVRVNRRVRRACSKQQPYFTNTKATSIFTNRKTEKEAEQDAYITFMYMGIQALLDMGLRDDFTFGQKEAEAFADKMVGLYDSFDKGYLDMNDIKETVYEETGLQFRRK